jgi:hypothetical protein
LAAGFVGSTVVFSSLSVLAVGLGRMFARLRSEEKETGY